MKTVEIVERIEGEAKLSCSWEDNKVSDARIDFLNFRGFEYILEGKPVLDSLVYTPRICGICGQAHLKATVEALEGIYENAGEKLNITPKAKLLREIGLNIEIIDSHIKWFYMFILPDVIKLKTPDLKEYTPLKGGRWLEASKTASETIKALALIGGQWPHTSYMIPGGVYSDPTLLELTTMSSYLSQGMKFFEKNLSGMEIEKYLGLSSINELDLIKGDLSYFKELSFEDNLHEYGKSYNEFITLGQDSIFNQGRLKQRFLNKIDLSKVKESQEYTFELNKTDNKKTTWAKSVSYNSTFYETGPLSRALIQNRRFIKDIHKNYDDSVFTRVMARMDELAHLLYHTKELISLIDISEESYIKPKYDLKVLEEGEAKVALEACRGSLYHHIKIKKGKIDKYDVITPTVWNLGPQKKNQKGIAQNAIIGSPSLDIAKIVLRSFDVCSVCTTH